MAKNIIYLTESEIKTMISEQVAKILKERRNYSTREVEIELYEIDFPDELMDFFEEHDEEIPSLITVELEYEIEPYDSGDYWTPPSGGYCNIIDANIDTDGEYKGLIPPELYPAFIQSINEYIDNHLDTYSEEIYDYYDSYEPDEDYYRYDD
jgi:hypothetical protein